MKKIISLVAACVCSLITMAQNLTADELIQHTNCKNYESFKQVMTRKGFSYRNNTTTDSKQIYLFLSNDRIETDGMSLNNASSIGFANDKTNTCVGFRTVEKEYYLKLISSFVDKGFEVTKTLNLDGQLVTSYRSKEYKDISLVVTIEKNSKDGMSWMSYDFQVARYA